MFVDPDEVLLLTYFCLFVEGISFAFDCPPFLEKVLYSLGWFEFIKYVLDVRRLEVHFVCFSL